MCIKSGAGVVESNTHLVSRPLKNDFSSQSREKCDKRVFSLSDEGAKNYVEV